MFRNSFDCLFELTGNLQGNQCIFLKVLSQYFLRDFDDDQLQKINEDVFPVPELSNFHVLLSQLEKFMTCMSFSCVLNLGFFNFGEFLIQVIYFSKIVATVIF
eukprot:TRINITY_DN9482_c0_g3_i3.p4 TRINITY_DN9482_c0_g3~~TRINITY_DN9482_c0_g3_i3.p4  ORF type:complete len:103 (-),score=8.44 TRINITY_DN9482_c0_g3_i3:161-469(-)